MEGSGVVRRPRMCNHTHTQAAYCDGGEACLNSGTRRCCGQLDPVRPGKVVMNHSARTFHLHLHSILLNKFNA